MRQPVIVLLFLTVSFPLFLHFPHKEDLKEFKKYVKTDEYVEEIARDKLGLVYKDEIIFEPEDSK